MPSQNLTTTQDTTQPDTNPGSSPTGTTLPYEHHSHPIECPECGGDCQPDTDAHSSDVVCQACGLITTEHPHIDYGPEWRSTADTDRRRATPASGVLTEYPTRTTIASPRELFHDNISTTRARTLSRLRHRDTQLAGDKDSGLATALSEINRMSSALGITTVGRKTAAKIYREARDRDLITGRTIEAMATGALYAAAKLTDQPHQLESVTDVARISASKPIYRAYTTLQQHLPLSIMPPDPTPYVTQLRSQLSLPSSYAQHAHWLLEQTPGTTLSGYSPRTVAASVLYAASITHPALPLLTQRRIVDAVDCTASSVRTLYPHIVAVSPQCDDTFASELRNKESETPQSPAAVVYRLHDTTSVDRYSTTPDTDIPAEITHSNAR